MSKTAILLQARTTSSRLPGKVLMKIGYHPMIFYIIKRLQKTGLSVIVFTSIDKSDDLLVKYLKEENIEVFRGSLQNVLQRFLDACKEYSIDQFFRITGDNPFVDIQYIMENYQKIVSFDYTDTIHGEGFVYGTGFEFVKVKELKEINSSNEFYLENVTSYLRENIKDRYCRLIPDDYRKINDKVFLSCDYEEDFTLISLIFALYNYRIDITTKEILDLFNMYPGIYKINWDKHQIPKY